jgi:hypothetical protein
VPALVYFEKGIPNVYDGEYCQDFHIHRWLIYVKEKSWSIYQTKSTDFRDLILFKIPGLKYIVLNGN